MFELDFEVISSLTQRIREEELATCTGWNIREKRPTFVTTCQTVTIPQRRACGTNTSLRLLRYYLQKKHLNKNSAVGNI